MIETRPGRFGISRPVWLLGWVSLATDAATEAIYPLLPLFLTQVLGAGAVSLGFIEGAAEATNSILKIVAGRLADRAAVKRPLVLVGYAVSSAARPLMAIAGSWGQVFAVRVTDRVGKGIRGAPRDAMLASLATPATRGKIYGFHRAMDHSGAVIGPIAATIFLYFYPGDYRTLFALTIVPGAIAVALIFLVREEGQPDASGFGQTREALAPAAGRSTAAALPRRLNLFFAVYAVFTLGNSTDAFLLLRLGEAAGSVATVPLLWAALHVVKASMSIVGGSWSDRIGRRNVIALGWIVYAVVYAGFAVTTSFAGLIVWFLVYGFYFGLTEGTEKALVADLAPAEQRGLAFGLFNAVQGIGALAASVVFGLVWTAFGPAVAFGMGGALGVAAAALLFVLL